MSKPSPQNDLKRHDAEPKFRRRYTCLAYIMAAVFLVCLAIVIGARWLCKSMYGEPTPAEIVQLREAETRIVQFPEEWHRPADIVPPSVIAFQKDFAKVVSEVTEDYGALLNPKASFDPMLYGMLPMPPEYHYASEKDTWSSRALYTRFQYAVDAIDDDQRTSYSLMMTRLAPVMDDASSATAQSGYTMLPEAASGRFILRLQDFAELMRTRSIVQLADGDGTAALQSAILPMKLIQHPEAVGTIYHLVAASVAITMSEAFCNVGMKTSDTQTLKNTLELMKFYRSRIIVIDKKNILVKELFINIRDAATYKLPVNIQPQTPAQIYRQYAWLQDDYAPWAIENLPVSNPYYDSAQKVMARRASAGSSPRLFARLCDKLLIKLVTRKLPTSPDSIFYGVGSQLLGFDFISYLVIKLNYSLGMNSMGLMKLEDVPIYTAYAMARYDLARLRLAQQLALVEGKMDMATSPTASAVAVAEYINPIPLDPFTSAPFKLSPQGQFYSVGPDKTDDHATVPYLPASGIASPGDIYFLPPKDPDEPDATRSIPAGVI